MSLDLKALEQQHQTFIGAKLNLDLTRGKPSSKQLDLSNALLTSIDVNVASGNNPEGTDLRNYGGVSGLSTSKEWFAELIGVPATEATDKVFVGSNSSLSLMHFCMWLAYYRGIRSANTGWQQEALATGGSIKMLCPSPGYDRHFSICEELGIEMIPVPLTGAGPDMNIAKKLISDDPLIKGIWCVPRFSNPTGEIYSDEVVNEIAQLGKIAGDNFLVFWDNAYAVHTFKDGVKELANILTLAKVADCEDSILHFASTSKITFAGAGIAAVASSKENIQAFSKHFSFRSIGPDKVNQFRHMQLLPDKQALVVHMQKHAELLKPKFDRVDEVLNAQLGNNKLGTWTKPDGGYFVSFNAQPGQAKSIIALAAEAGVKLTPAGSVFPYKNDPEDSNIRLAPSFPEMEELEKALQIFCNCVKLSAARKTG